MTATSMEELVSLAKRRGFIFQSSDIYGGLQGDYDYGHWGAEVGLGEDKKKTPVFGACKLGGMCVGIDRV